jgi:UDP-2,4-diacetamido-2,4,6-trideoxy-beta-L-altropyranose hydrolase
MNLVWREARMTDADLLWRWANDLETRQNSFARSPIPYAEHVAWLEQHLGSEATRMWIFSDRNVPVGQVRFDIADAVAEIGITVAPEARGRGYGKAILEQAIRCLRAERRDRVWPRASVLAHNAASLRLFKACGFEEVRTIQRDSGERVIVLELARVLS